MPGDNSVFRLVGFPVWCVSQCVSLAFYTIYSPFTPVEGRNDGNTLGHNSHFNEYTAFQRQRLDIRYLNLAQISGCKPICTIIMDSLVDPFSCSPGNATHAFVDNYR